MEFNDTHVGVHFVTELGRLAKKTNYARRSSSLILPIIVRSLERLEGDSADLAARNGVQFCGNEDI